MSRREHRGRPARAASPELPPRQPGRGGDPGAGAGHLPVQGHRHQGIPGVADAPGLSRARGAQLGTQDPRSGGLAHRGPDRPGSRVSRLRPAPAGRLRHGWADREPERRPREGRQHTMTVWSSRFPRGYAVAAREAAARGLPNIEGFLYREAHRGATHRRVAAFTARVEGLTPEQKRDIEQWYVDEQKHVARMVTDH